MEGLENGVQITSGSSSCSGRKLRSVSSDAPLRERALCNFEYVLNYNPKVHKNANSVIINKSISTANDHEY